MKAFSFLCLMLAWASLQAQFLINPYAVNASGGGPATYTAKDSVSGTTNGSSQPGNASLNVGAVGVEFTPATSYTVTKVDLQLAKVGTPTQDYQCEIWTQSGTLPGVIVGTASAAVNASTFPSSEGTVSFYPSATVTAGTPYYVVLRAASLNASNYVNMYRISASGRIDVYNPAGMGVWSNSSTSRRSKFQTYSSP